MYCEKSGNGAVHRIARTFEEEKGIRRRCLGKGAAKLSSFCIH